MDSNLTFAQRRSGFRHAFRFDSDKLAYTVFDYSGQNEFSVLYDQIDTDNASRVTVNNGRRYRTMFAGLLIFLGLAIAGAQFDKTVSGLAIMLDGLLMLALLIARLCNLFAVRYTLLPIPPRSGQTTIRIIADAQHDRIVDEIKRRRLARLRWLYGDVNFANDPAAEMRKFEILRERGVIGERECHDAIARLRAVQLKSRAGNA